VLTGPDLGPGTTDPSGAWPLERRPLPFETSLPRVFSIGDVRHRSVKRVGAAVGEGSVVVSQLHECLLHEEPRRLPVGTGMIR
jgi:thioredoxin reductase